nr:LysR family transcriptional regulator [Sphingomonas sp. Y57]
MPGISRRTYEISVQDHRLQYLSLSARHGSMRAAADYLGVAASSISRQIKLLERALSIDLVEKGSYKVQLTEAGQLLIEYYERRVVEHQELLARLAELRSTRTSTIRIVVAQGLLAVRFLKAFATVSTKFPDINIEMKAADGDEAERLVLNDGAQLGLLFDTAQDVRLKLLATSRQPFSLFMSEKHPLAREEVIWPVQISGERLVMPDAGSRLLEIIHSVFTERGLPLNIVMKSPSIQVILDSVAQGMGVAMLPRILGQPAASIGGIVERPILSDELSDIRLHLVSRAGRRMTPAALALQNALVREMNRLDEDPSDQSPTHG